VRPSPTDPASASSAASATEVLNIERHRPDRQDGLAILLERDQPPVPLGAALPTILGRWRDRLRRVPEEDVLALGERAVVKTAG
jgi:hypothetical protein